jgi:hypothetical protein
VPVSADDTGQNAAETDYLENLKIVTNQFTGAVVYPYEVDFRCFSEELGDVLEAISKSPYSIILKTVDAEPGQVRNIKPTIASAQSVFGVGIPSPYGAGGPGSSPYGAGGPGSSPYGAGGPGGPGGPGGFSSAYGGGATRGADSAASVYGGGATSGRRDARRGAAGTSGPYGSGSPYGGSGSRVPVQATTPAYSGPPGTQPPPPVLPQPTGPEVILTEEPLKVTLGFAIIRMPEAPAPAAPAKN